MKAVYLEFNFILFMQHTIFSMFYVYFCTETSGVLEDINFTLIVVCYNSEINEQFVFILYENLMF